MGFDATWEPLCSTNSITCSLVTPNLLWGQSHAESTTRRLHSCTCAAAKQKRWKGDAGKTGLSAEKPSPLVTHPTAESVGLLLSVSQLPQTRSSKDRPREELLIELAHSQCQACTTKLAMQTHVLGMQHLAPWQVSKMSMHSSMQ